MLTSTKNEAVKFRDEREIYRCTRKRHASGRGSPPSQPSQLLRLHSLHSADIHNTPSNLCGGERGQEASLSPHITFSELRVYTNKIGFSNCSGSILLFEPSNHKCSPYLKMRLFQNRTFAIFVHIMIILIHTFMLF